MKSKIQELLVQLNVRAVDVENILSILEPMAKDIDKMELMYDILEAEYSLGYFSEDHFKQSLAQKRFLDNSFIEVCSNVFGVLNPSPKFSGESIHLSAINTEPNISKAVEGLRHEGFHVFDIRLKDSTVDDIIDHLAQVSFYVRNSVKRIKGYRRAECEKIKSNTAWIHDQQDLNRFETIQDIVFDPYILSIVGAYFGSVPIHVQTNCWWSINYNNSRNEMSSNAQLYHQDKEFVKFLKVFIYLTDVDERNGAHVYVRGSHVDNRVASSRPDYKYSSRVEDKDIEHYYGLENIVAMIGKKGTIVIEDTNGFHKGMPVIEGHRLLLQIEYANCLYFNPVLSFKKSTLQDRYIDKLQSLPRLGLNYDDTRYSTGIKKLNRARFIKGLKGYVKNMLVKY